MLLSLGFACCHPAWHSPLPTPTLPSRWWFLVMVVIALSYTRSLTWHHRVDLISQWLDGVCILIHDPVLILQREEKNGWVRCKKGKWEMSQLAVLFCCTDTLEWPPTTLQQWSGILFETATATLLWSPLMGANGSRLLECDAMRVLQDNNTLVYVHRLPGGGENGNICSYQNVMLRFANTTTATDITL